MDENYNHLDKLDTDEIIFKDEKKVNALNKINNLFEENLLNVHTLKDLYTLIESIISEINIIYEKIGCKKGCGKCCKFYSSPQTYNLEWNYIKNHIETNFSKKEIEYVRQKFLGGINNLKSMLEQNIGMSKNLNDNFYLSVFFLSECPFLVKNECTIYNVRPLICRIFGYSKEINKNALENSEEFDKILTCREEIERWKNEVNKGNVKKIYLPYMRILEKKIYEISLEENFNLFYHSLDYWLTEYFNEY